MRTISEIDAEIKKWSEKIYRCEICGERYDYTSQDMRGMVLDLLDLKVIIENNPVDAFDIIKKKALKVRATVEQLW